MSPVNDKISPSLDKGLTALEYLAERSHDSNSLSHLSRELGIPKTSLLRLLVTLRRRGYVQQDEEGRYRIGTRLLEFDTVSRPWPRLRGAAYPVMCETAQAAGEACHLSVLSEGGAVFLDKVEAPKSVITVTTRIGGKAALHASASGKVLVAALTQADLERTLDLYGLPRLTENTITSVPKFKDHLVEVLQQGYAVDLQEEEEGISCVAAPLKDHRGGVVAAISLTGLSPGFGPERMDRLANMVKRAAAKISMRLGYKAEGYSIEA